MSHPPKADAFWFGPGERRAFGWYHLPHGEARDLAVVLCPPLGHEMLCMHRAYRHLAEQLSSAGLPVLRFDYHGTGDSAGSDHDGNRLPEWLATIDQAIDLMCASGASRIALFGVRMGATLAAAAAMRRRDVAALALVAPCVSGGGYLRELRAMHRLRDRGEKRPRFHGQRDGDEEAIGFVFRRETVEALSRVDLRTIEGTAVERVLIIPRDDLPGGEARIAERLTVLGSNVEIRAAPGYAALAPDDPYLAGVPHAIWTVASQWLAGTTATHERTAPVHGETGIRRTNVGAGVFESALRYGDDANLFGVLSEPSRTQSDLAIIIANTGANTRVGPNRLGVTLARRLALRGHAVLRLDLAGIGDSAPQPGMNENELYAERSVTDLRASVDVLEAHGYRRFVAMGLCAGAYMSFRAGVVDDRIEAMILMNPAALEWEPGRKVERVDGRVGTGSIRSTRYYKSRALRLDTWRRIARGDVDTRAIALALSTRLRDRATTSIKRAALVAGRGHWVMTDLARDFASLAQRDVRVLMLLSSEEPMIDELDRHIGSMMGWLEKRGLSLEVIDNTDHVFAPVWSQDRALEIVTEFVDGVARCDANQPRLAR
jgi:alpha-beta hydrolase superfamily lysophospholipase